MTRSARRVGTTQASMRTAVIRSMQLAIVPTSLAGAPVIACASAATIAPPEAMRRETCHVALDRAERAGVLYRPEQPRLQLNWK